MSIEHCGANDETRSGVKDSNLIEYQNCFIAFLDILGFSNKVLESLNNTEMLKVLRDSMGLCSSLSTGDKKLVERNGVRREIHVQSRFFSDSIAVFMRTRPENISHLFFMIRFLQDRLWEKGICLRGAVTIGGMYWPPSSEASITLGPGLIEAHELESKKAKYPRILVSAGLYNYVEANNIEAYPFAREGKLRTRIRQDNDRLYFLDLLNRRINRTRTETLAVKHGDFAIRWVPDSHSNFDTILDEVELLLAANEDSDDEQIREKFAWLRNYKNINCG